VIKRLPIAIGHIESGLEFLMGNSENIKRQNDINAGIYTAKAV